MSTNLTAGYLIGLLKDLPSDTPLLVRGYEDGVDYVTSIEAVKVHLFQNDEWYYGQHQPSPDGLCEGVMLCGEHVKNPNNETSK